MAMYGLKDATPTDPNKQFSGRYRAGLGMAYGPQRASGAPELFGNTPLEVSNRREFASLKHDFLIAHDIDATNVWEIVGGATLAVVADSPNGLATLTATNSTANTVSQMQFFSGGVTAAGEVIDPINQEIVCQAWCGKMPYALTSDWFIGVTEDAGAASVLAIDGTMNSDHYMGFHHLEDATSVDLVIGDGTELVITNPLTALWTPADGVDSLRELAVMMVGNRKYYWFVDGICVGATQVGDTETATGVGGTTVTLFTDKMSPIISMRNGDEDEAAVAYVDYQLTATTRLNAPVGG